MTTLLTQTPDGPPSDAAAQPAVTSASAGGLPGTVTPSWFTTLQHSSLVLALTLIGLAAGFFFTYQISIVPALAEVDDETYVATFQSINETIRNASFAIVFFGAIPALCMAWALHARTADRRRIGIVIALVLYVAVFAITAIGNVPLNEQLADVIDPDQVAATAARADFEDSWNRLNLIRAIGSTAALIGLAAGAVAPRRR